MKNLINKLNQNSKIIIRNEEYLIETKTWYMIEEDKNTSYVKCELSNNRVLLPDRGNVKADVYADILNIEDIEIIE